MMAMRRRDMIATSVGLGAGVVLGQSVRTVDAAEPTQSVSISVAGLVALVRSKLHSQASPNLGTVKALAVDAMKASASKRLPPHMSVLRIAAAGVSNAKDFPKDLANKGYIIMPLEGVIVKLASKGNPIGGDVWCATSRDDTPELAYCPRPHEWHEIDWLPNMEYLAPNVKVKATYLTGTFTADVPLASRIELAAGYLECQPPSDSMYGQARVQFSSSRYHHVLTDMVRYVSMPIEKLSLQFYAASTMTMTAEMSLQTHSGPTFPIPVSIENLIAPGYAHYKDHHENHFRAYYALLDGYNGTLYQPDKGLPCPSCGTAALPDWPIYCPPPLMTA
jgi:hypothetical protein